MYSTHNTRLTGTSHGRRQRRRRRRRRHRGTPILTPSLVPKIYSVRHSQGNTYCVSFPGPSSTQSESKIGLSLIQAQFHWRVELQCPT